MNYSDLPSAFAFAAKAGLSPAEAAVLPAVFDAAAIVGEKDVSEVIAQALRDAELEGWVTTHAKLVAREMSK